MCKTFSQKKVTHTHKKRDTRSSHCGSVVAGLTGVHEDVGSIPGLAQWVKDPVLLWAVAEAGSYSYGLNPRPGTFICLRCGPEKKKIMRAVMLSPSL